jgi:hypothetical protein
LRLRGLFEHTLLDGRRVEDLPVDEVTRQMLGEVIAAIKAAGKSKATVEHGRMPLKGFYREQVERKALTSNLSGDLGYFVGRMKRGRPPQP